MKLTNMFLFLAAFIILMVPQKSKSCGYDDDFRGSFQSTLTNTTYGESHFIIAKDIFSLECKGNEDKGFKITMFTKSYQNGYVIINKVRNDQNDWVTTLQGC